MISPVGVTLRERVLRDRRVSKIVVEILRRKGKSAAQNDNGRQYNRIFVLFLESAILGGVEGGKA